MTHRRRPAAAPAWTERRPLEARPLPWASRELVEAPSEPPQEIPGQPSAPEWEPRVRELEAERARLQGEIRRLEAEQEALRRALDDEESDAEALRRTVAQLEASLAQLGAVVIDDAARELTALAIAIGRRIVARELELDPTLPVAWAREAIATSRLGQRVTVAVSPEVLAGVPPSAWGDLAPAVEVDPTLAGGAMEIRAGSAGVSAGADDQLSLLEEELDVDDLREAA